MNFFLFLLNKANIHYTFYFLFNFCNFYFILFNKELIPIFGDFRLSSEQRTLIPRTALSTVLQSKPYKFTNKKSIKNSLSDEIVHLTKNIMTILHFSNNKDILFNETGKL